ncbi:hypothetical protein [Saccharopolyspora shandongensis]|uniref:hypothetical protein n=1 Tax=Saccharopolyspora shandongensis TaxID=418495 RepID=UPI0033C6B269
MTNHWSNYLVRGFPYGEDSTVTLTVDPEKIHPNMLVFASRAQGIFDALSPLFVGEHDPLADEDASELLRLADHLHRVIMHLVAAEDRLLEVLTDKGTSTRTIATALEVAPQTVLNRIKRIAAAGAEGMNTAAWQDKKDADDEVRITPTHHALIVWAARELGCREQIAESVVQVIINKHLAKWPATAIVAHLADVLGAQNPAATSNFVVDTIARYEMRFEVSHLADDGQTVSVPAETKSAARREARTLQELGIEATVHDTKTGETEIFSGPAVDQYEEN